MSDFAESDRRSEPVSSPMPEGDGEPQRSQTVDRLFRDHNAELLRFLRVKLQNDSEAREIAQEAYVRLLQLRDTGAVSFLRAYLFKIAANLAVDRIRDRQRGRQTREEWSSEAEVIPDPFDIERSVLAAEDIQVFLQCLGELPPKCQAAFVLHRLKKLSTQEVAAKLEITPRMVRKHITRALIYCRYRLDGLSAEAAMERLSHE